MSNYVYDDRVVDLVRSGVATIGALRRELNIPGNTMKVVMRRLLKSGRIRAVTRGWFKYVGD